MERTPLLSLRDLSVAYDDREVLHDVALTIYADDFLGIIGPNGGGKTTLVRAILGNLPYRGTIDYSPLLLRHGRRLIGYLPQQSLFDRSFPISVLETVLSGLQGEKGFHGRYTPDDERRAAELLAQTGIAPLARKAIGELSGGQMQRAMLCRALIGEPRLLILDEPTNFVDNRFEHELYELLHELNRRMAIVMVTHDVGTVPNLVKSIVCVNGRVHRHDSNCITAEQLQAYDCPIRLISHGTVPHTVLEHHPGDGSAPDAPSSGR